MSKIIPPENMAALYDQADENMMLRVLDGPQGPGLVLLATLRQLTQKQLTSLASNLEQEARSRIDTDASLSQTLSTLATAVNREATTRGDADKALDTRVTNLEKSVTALLAENARRHEVVRGTVATAGTPVSVTFAKAFSAPPVMVDITSWSSDQATLSAATETTATGARIVVKRSRGTLLLTSGPFENAPAGTPFVMIALGS